MKTYSLLGRLRALAVPLALPAVWSCNTTPARVTIRESPRATLVRQLHRNVQVLAGQIGERSKNHPAAAAAAADHIERAFRSLSTGVHVQRYTVDGIAHRNICLEFPGSLVPREIVVVGAHYDTAAGSPGADDNASGIAGILALAERFVQKPPPYRSIRLVAFGTEEPPYIRTEHMGSYHYARACRQRNETIVQMLSLDMIGYFSDAPGSQKAPPQLEGAYPTVGNFVVFAGDTSNASAITAARDRFAGASRVPAETMILPAPVVRRARVPLGANSSDQWSFWQWDYPGMMITDTANWRNENYHQPTDTPQTLDYERMAHVVEGLEALVLSWANEGAGDEASKSGTAGDR